MKRLLCSTLLLCCLLMQSCSSPDNTKLSVGTNQWPGYETLYLARELGYFESQNIKLIELASATDVITAFKLGQLDVAALTLDEVISVASDIPDLVIFLVMDISHGADKLVANERITSIKDLTGKKVGYEKTALGAFFLSEFLAATAINRDDLILVRATVDQHEILMRTNQLDAVITFEPTASKLLSLGYNDLFNSSQMPGKIMDVLVTTQSALKDKHDLINKLVSSHWQALDYMDTNTSQAMKLISLRLHAPPEQVSASYAGLILPDRTENIRLMQGDLQAATRSLNKLMTDYGLIDQMVDIQHLTTQQFIQ